VSLHALIDEIERSRDSRVLLLAASALEIDILPTLYDILRGLGRTERLDVLVYCRGGQVTAARRVGLMLDSFTRHLSFIVPDRCESSATILILAGREIVAGPVALFSPVDPMLPGPADDSGEDPSAICAEDVRLFGAMARDWFGLDSAEAQGTALSILSGSIFPTTLTAFYRSSLEVRQICHELLSLHRGEGAGESREAIVEALVSGQHSHAFPLCAGDLERLGLPVRGDEAVEGLAWEVARSLRASIGAGVRATDSDDWHDALIATRESALRRRRSRGGRGLAWEAAELE
jgi:hypothetical protein